MLRFNVIHSFLNKLYMSVSTGCISPQITNECIGSPMFLFINDDIVPLTIFWVDVPILARPMH